MFDILGLSEIGFCGVRGVKSGWGREGVAGLTKERIPICVKEIRKVSYRIMYMRLCLKLEFLSGVNVYAQVMERRERFWEELKGCIEAYKDKFRD